MTTNNNAILSKIRKVREYKNLSQELVSEKMHISQAQYARFERGATKTDLKTLCKFCDAVSMDLIDLITYPDKYINIREIKGNDPVEAVLQIKLSSDKKDQVMKIVFGQNNLEILNK